MCFVSLQCQARALLADTNLPKWICKAGIRLFTDVDWIQKEGSLNGLGRYLIMRGLVQAMFDLREGSGRSKNGGNSEDDVKQDGGHSLPHFAGNG